MDFHPLQTSLYWGPTPLFFGHSLKVGWVFEHFITFLAVSYGKILHAEFVFASMDLKSPTPSEAWFLSVQNDISKHSRKLGMVAHACKKDLFKIFLSYIARQGQPRLQETLSQSTPLPFLFQKKSLRIIAVIKVAIVSGGRARKQLFVCLKIEYIMARHGGHGSHGSSGWLLTRDLLASVSCVWGYRSVLPCLTVIPHFQK